MNEDNDKEKANSLKIVDDKIQTIMNVRATLEAWNANPSIVKKELDKQKHTISDLKKYISELEEKNKMSKSALEIEMHKRFKSKIEKEKVQISN